MKPIEITTNFGPDEMKISAWIMSKSKTTILASKALPVAAGIAVIAFGIYYRVKGGTNVQLAILAILGVVCIIRGILAEKWPLDHSERATRMNSDLIGRPIRYVFSDDGIESTSFYGTGSMSWSKVKSYGEKNGYFYMVVKGGQAIVLNESELGQTSLTALKEKLQTVVKN